MVAEAAVSAAAPASEKALERPVVLRSKRALCFLNCFGAGRVRGRALISRRVFSGDMASMQHSAPPSWAPRPLQVGITESVERAEFVVR